jgi:FixJ family two-component response regulator
MPDLPTIAIVDDDRGIREALSGLVQSLGYQPMLFASAEDYLASANQSAVACMIVDVRMPGMSGIELQAWLNSQGARPPIIFLTSYLDEATRSRALEGGARHFLVKPVDDEVLISCLNAALAQA